MSDTVELVTKLFDAYNARDVDAVRALISTDYREQRTSRAIEGADAFVANYENEWSNRPDCQLEVRQVRLLAGTALIEGSWHVTSAEPLTLPEGNVLEPTGRRGALEFMATFESDGEVLTSGVWYYDTLAFWRSLGHTVTVT